MDKITPEFVESKIVAEHYFLVPGTTTTICALVAENEVVEVDVSSTAAHITFNEEDGRRIARQKAFGKLWGAYGIILKNKMFEEAKHVQNDARPD